MVGNAETHHVQLRRKLEARGVAPEDITRQVEELRARQEAARTAAGPTGQAFLDRQQDETYARLSPDDSKHRPRTPDRLRSGAGRVSAITAKAAARRKALTRYEYDQLTAGGES